MSLMLFSNRLKELMSMDNISCRALALKTGLQRKSIANWLKGEFYPRYDALIKLANFFKVSINFLLCLSDDYIQYNNISDYSKSFIQSQFSERLIKFINDNKISKYRLAKLLGLGQTTVERWVSVGAMPETEVLIKLSEIMDETVDYLLGRDYT